MQIYYAAIHWELAVQGVSIRTPQEQLKLVLYDDEHTDKSTVKFKKPKK